MYRAKCIIIFIIFLFEALLCFGKTDDDKINFFITTQEQFTTKIEDQSLTSLYLNTQLYTDFSFPYKKYTFTLWTMDILIVDVSRPQEYEALDYFYNYFNLGFDHQVTFKNIIEMKYNMDIALDTPFNNSKSLELNPNVQFSGNYYTGIFWNFKQQQNIYYYFTEEYFDFHLNHSLQVGYEFFRFYGPEDFKFTVFLKDGMDWSWNQDLIFNEVKTGLQFDIFQFRPEILFINNFYYDYGTTQMLEFNIGIRNILKYQLKNLIFSLEHNSYYDTIEAVWSHKISTYVKYFFNYEFNNPPVQNIKNSYF